MRVLEEAPRSPEGEAGDGIIEDILAQLRSHDWMRREHARWQLVTLREAAVFPLIDALEDPDWHVRWEAAKALHDIADPRAAAALVKALRDRRFGVRWLASDALIALRENSLPPLLSALVHHGDSILLRNGAHHVLRDLSRLSYEEVGRTLGITPATARVYRRHAVVKLAESLGGRDGL